MLIVWYCVYSRIRTLPNIAVKFILRFFVDFIFPFRT